MRSSSSIALDGAAYRRGIVLGLTMAEIMLLLVFCLLIALSVLFSRQKERSDLLAAKLGATQLLLTKEQAKSASLETKVADLEAEIQQLDELLKKTQPSGPNEDWRELIEARQVVQKIQAGGTDPREVARYASQLKELVALLGNDVKASDVADTWRQVQEAKTELKASSSGGLDSNLKNAIIEGAKAEREAKLGKGEHNWPPIINLSEARGYSFAIGKADLTPEFEKRLRTAVVDQVAKIVAEYDVDIVEVIGHTDEQSVNSRSSNLDDKVIPALYGKVRIAGVTPADNAGLGMARAVSVASVLKNDPRLRSVAVLPLSGGQMILPGDQLTDGTKKGDVKERRRIEIRVRRSAKKLAEETSIPANVGAEPDSTLPSN